MVVSKMELYELLRKADSADVDFLREGVRTLAQALMEVEVAAQIGAEHSQRTPQRVTHRNGYRPRDWDTRVGTVELEIPRLRQGSYFPSILEPRRRAERALAAVVMQCYVEGVSTRRVDDVARSMGLEGISKSQVSRICAELDEVADAWRNRPLDAGPDVFVWVDALSMKVREGGRVCNTAVLVATACNADGHRELLGLELGSAEDGAVWTGFLPGLVARGLSGVRLVTSDAHQASRRRSLRCWTAHPGSAAAPIEAVKILRVVFDSRGLLGWYARHAHATGGPSAARCKVRGVAAAPERAAAALGGGRRGPAAGAWRGARGRAGRPGSARPPSAMACSSWRPVRMPFPAGRVRRAGGGRKTAADGRTRLVPAPAGVGGAGRAG